MTPMTRILPTRPPLPQTHPSLSQFLPQRNVLGWKHGKSRDPSLTPSRTHGSCSFFCRRRMGWASSYDTDTTNLADGAVINAETITLETAMRDHMREASQPFAVVERSDTTGCQTTKQGIPEGCETAPSVGSSPVSRSFRQPQHTLASLWDAYLWGWKVPVVSLRSTAG